MLNIIKNNTNIYTITIAIISAIVYSKSVLTTATLAHAIAPAAY